MRRYFAATLIALVATATILAPRTSAITGHFTPDAIHPYVGLVAFYDANGEYVGRCSGSLLSPTIFLTAAHCLVDAVSARIWFQQDVGGQYDPTIQLDSRTGYRLYCVPGDRLCVESHTLVSHPEFTGAFPSAQSPNQFDVAILILDTAVPTSAISEYAVLAAPHALDTLEGSLRRGARPPVTLSGYGVSDVQPDFVQYLQRFTATAQIHNIGNNTGSVYLQLSNNPGDGRGGVCYGDSGSPILWDNSNIVVAVFALITPNCGGLSFAYRVDTEAVYAWITGVTGVMLPTAQP